MKSTLLRSLIAVCLCSLLFGTMGCSKSDDTTADTAKPATTDTSGTAKPPVAGGPQKPARDMTQ